MSDKPGEIHKGHSHADSTTPKTRLMWALALALSVVVIQFIGSWITGSLALAADAGHGIVDSIGLIIALAAAVLATKPRSDKRTWGFARAEVIGAGLQAGILIALCLYIASEAIQRFWNPTEVIAGPMLWIGLIGIAANVTAMIILSKSRHQSLNMQAAFLEVTSDTLGSVAVVAAGIITLTTGWVYADSAASLLIAVMIGIRASMVLRQSARILLEETPASIDLAKAREVILNVPHTVGVHDLHASTIGTGINILSAHVIVTQECVDQGLTVDVLHLLQDHLNNEFPEINHMTLQIDNDLHASHEDLAH